MSQTPGIRETVKVLLALLTDCGCPHVPSESFRQAKYDRPEAVEPFWRILQHVLCVLQFLKSGDLRDMREVIATATATATHCGSNEKIALSVRRHALDLQYHRPKFYADSVGSCELLLFFAWMFHATSFISRLQSYHVNAALHSMSIPLSSSKYFMLEQVQKNTASLDRQVESLVTADSDAVSLDDALRKIQWLKGMMFGSGRSVENSHKATVKLSHTILQSCTGSKPRRQPLSLHDLFLLRYPEQLSASVRRLEWHTASLHNLVKWQQHESVFWQWMESVLDQHTAAVHTSSPDTAVQGTDVESTTTKLCVDKLSEEVAERQQKLSRRIEAKKPLIERLHKATKSKEASDSKPDHQLSLQHVPVERCVLCPAPASQSSNTTSSDSSQYRAVEREIARLQAITEETEHHLHSLMSTVAEYLP